MTSILTKRTASTLQLIFNRPELGNSLNEEAILLLLKEVRSGVGDSSLHSLILTGAGTRFFCTGADLKELSDPARNIQPLVSAFVDVMDALKRASLFTAAFVNGDCLGGGLGIALSTDFILTVEHGRFGTPEITRGLFPFVISPVLVEKLGSHHAMGLCFGGRIWSSEDALRRGIASETVPTEDWSRRTTELIALWETADLELLRHGKRAIVQHETQTRESLMKDLLTSVDKRRVKP